MYAGRWQLYQCRKLGARWMQANASAAAASASASTSQSKSHTESPARIPAVASIIQARRILKVTDESSTEELKSSYLQLVKIYHPDVEGGSNIDFSRLSQAYDLVRNDISTRETHSQKHLSPEEAAFEAISQWESNLSNTGPSGGLASAKLPQHRKHLEFEGVGFGSQQARQSQYRAFRVERAADRMATYRSDRMWAESRKSVDRSKNSDADAKDHAAYDVIVGYQRSARSGMIQNKSHVQLMEEAVEAAMKDWNMSESPYFGKPLSHLDSPQYSYSPDPLTYKIQQIVQREGYVPEWIELQGTIDSKYREIFQDLLHIWNSSKTTHSSWIDLHKDQPNAAQTQHIDDTNLPSIDYFVPVQLTYQPSMFGSEWNAAIDEFRTEIKALNQLIYRYNCLVPIPSKQRILYLADNMVEFVQSLQPSLQPTKSGSYLPNSSSNIYKIPIFVLCASTAVVGSIITVTAVSGLRLNKSNGL